MPTPTPEPSIETLTEENFRALLTIEDVQSYLTTEVALTTRLYGYKEMATSADLHTMARLCKKAGNGQIVR